MATIIRWEGTSTAGVDRGFLSNVTAALQAVGATAVNVTSARRTPETNPGVSNSNHLYGYALDGSALINGVWVPIGTALKSVASQFGLRSGDVAGFYLGKPDPIHIDDGYNVGGGKAMTATGGSLDSFFSAVLAIIGAPVNKNNLAYLSTWSKREGTAAANNPLATTQQTANSYALPGNAAINNGIAVQQYPTVAEGARATAQTLLNGRYPHVVAALRSGDPYGYQSRYAGSIGPELSTWSGSGYTSVPKPDSGGGVTGTIGDIAGGIIDNSPLAPIFDNPIVGGAQGAADALGSISGFFGAVTDPHNILRGLQVLSGAVLVGGGLFLLAKQVGLADAALTATPVGRAGKAAAGASVAGTPSPQELEAEYAKGQRQAALGQARQAGRRSSSGPSAQETERSANRSRESARRDTIRTQANAIEGDIPF